MAVHQVNANNIILVFNYKFGLKYHIQGQLVAVYLVSGPLSSVNGAQTLPTQSSSILTCCHLLFS